MGHALVVGAGIGGLTTALCLARVGWRVTLIEQADVLAEVGAGIQLTPNAMRVFDWLALSPALDRLGHRPTGVVTRAWRSGREITRTTIHPSDAPTYLQVHRADLIDVLSRTAMDDPLVDISLGEAVLSIETTPRNATAETSKGRRIEADVVIGADGIHSVVRESMFGPASPRFTGHVAWRGLIDAETIDADVPKNVVAWWGPARHFVHYFVRDGRLINCVAVVEQKAWQSESWVESGDAAALIDEFRDWHPLVRDLLAGLDPSTCYKWGLFDRAPLPAWGIDSATLVGDACHPTLPFLAQGGALAIEDAAVLAGCLASGETLPALRRFETLRRKRTARVQRASKRNGTIFHLTGVAALARNLAAQPFARRVLDSVFEYDAIREGASRGIEMATTISRDGVRIHYTCIGSGEGLCLIHGYGGAAADWRHVGTSLDDGYSMVAVDWRGHGESRDVNPTAVFSVARFVDDILAAVDAVPMDRFHLVGHSIGGGVAQEIAVRHPERVLSLVLADTTDWFGDHDEPGGTPPFLPPETLQLAARRRQEMPGRIRDAAWQALIDWPGVRDRLGSIACPTLILHGERDASRILEGSERLRRAIPGARLVVVPGAGHSPHLEEPARFIEALGAHLEDAKRRDR